MVRPVAPVPNFSSARIWLSWRVVEPNSRTLASLRAAASVIELRSVMMVVNCSRVVTPRSELRRSALESSSRAARIFLPFPSVMATAASLTSAIGPPPLPSPLSDLDTLSSMSSTRSKATGVLVRVSPMVSWFFSTGPPRYGGVSSTWRSVRIEVLMVTARTAAGIFTFLSTVSSAST